MLTKEELDALKKTAKRYKPKQWAWAQKQWTPEQFRRYLTRTDSWGERLPELRNTGLYSGFIEHNCGVGNGTGVQCAVTINTPIHQHMLRHWLSNRKHVIVTCNSKQTELCKRWIDYGFEVVRDWTMNPNTGREIIVLMYSFPDSSELKGSSSLGKAKKATTKLVKAA